jgi:hypothetical protein
MKSGWNLLGILGDFTINYLLLHQEIIIDDKNDWYSIAKIVLREFYKAGGMNLPAWIDIISDGNQFEEAEVEEEEIIRGYFKRKIIDTFSRNYRTLVAWEDQKIDSASNKYMLMNERLNFCLDNQLISYLRRKNSEEIFITIDILKELRDIDISSIQSFTDLARLLGGNIKPAKVDRTTARPIIISIAKFIEFIDRDPPE